MGEMLLNLYSVYRQEAWPRLKGKNNICIYIGCRSLRDKLNSNVNQILCFVLSNYTLDSAVAAYRLQSTVLSRGN